MRQRGIEGAAGWLLWAEGVIALAAILSLFFPQEVRGSYIGVCSNCHTMHNSQNGQPMARDENGNPLAVPYSRLLISTCIGCHTNATSATIVNNAPIVNNLIEPVQPLAGGNFYYVDGDDTHGHNVFSSNPDEALGDIPPGGSFPAGGTYAGQLRCAGTRGCHGLNGGHSEAPVDDQLLALSGGHHANASIANGTAVGSSYRFLYGIAGKEDDTWEQAGSNLHHNEYKGSVGPSDTSSINYLCSECHGDFHSSSGIGTSSPWLRHPTDVTLPAGLSEYANYVLYNSVAPVARQDPFNVPDTTKVTPGQDVVMCLSCHRAHGSPYYKGLRWDYKSATLQTALSGCGVCHTSKN